MPDARAAQTPEPPYYAVIFTSLRTADDAGYAVMAQTMEALARMQEGFLGIESARDGLGITVSYWASPEAIRAWKAQCDHQLAQKFGRQRWYRSYRVRIARVEREYGFDG